MKFQISNFKIQSARGFTLIELGLVMGIFSTLVALATINLMNAQRSSSLSAATSTFITDLKQQQLKAMVGDTEGRVDALGKPKTDTQGVYIESASYTLFYASYSAVDPSNFKLNQQANIQLSTTFPSSEITFLKGSGEISTAGSVTFRDKNVGTQKVVSINKYGVVTGVN